mmetsp:Transcript_88261/g.257998  ORF Transcript_88261/g.257998 Transcript_88261/m.257998 type:complete len:294 (+) Transcript_88261:505-1386(+)
MASAHFETDRLFETVLVLSDRVRLGSCKFVLPLAHLLHVPPDALRHAPCHALADLHGSLGEHLDGAEGLPLLVQSLRAERQEGADCILRPTHAVVNPLRCKFARSLRQLPDHVEEGTVEFPVLRVFLQILRKLTTDVGDAVHRAARRGIEELVHMLDGAVLETLIQVLDLLPGRFRQAVRGDLLPCFAKRLGHVGVHVGVHRSVPSWLPYAECSVEASPNHVKIELWGCDERLPHLEQGGARGELLPFYVLLHHLLSHGRMALAHLLDPVQVLPVHLAGLDVLADLLEGLCAV